MRSRPRGERRRKRQRKKGTDKERVNQAYRLAHYENRELSSSKAIL